jgi:hypothetical protein
MKTLTAVVALGLLAGLNILIAWSAHASEYDVNRDTILLLCVVNALVFLWMLRGALARHVEARAIAIPKQGLVDLKTHETIAKLALDDLKAFQDEQRRRDATSAP